jgi:hypothetical protein
MMQKSTCRVILKLTLAADRDYPGGRHSRYCTPVIRRFSAILGEVLELSLHQETPPLVVWITRIEDPGQAECFWNVDRGSAVAPG